MRRLSLALVLLASLATASEAQLYIIQGQLSQTWTCATNSVAAVLTECKAAATGGQRHHITDIIVQTTTATSGTYAIQSGTGSNCGSNTTTVFPNTGNVSHRWNAPITTQSASWFRFGTPIRVTANHAICHIGVATNTTSVQIHGFTQ